MTRRAYLYFGLTFIFGIILGAAGFYAYATQTGHWHRHFSRERLIQQMTRDLDLSSDQVQQLRGILDDSGKKYHAMEQQVEEQAHALHQETRGRIRQMLRPEQAAKYDAIINQHEKERRRRGN